MIEITASLLTSALVQVFERLKWDVRTRDQVDSDGADLVVKDPDDKTFVIEVKVGSGSAHFASLAQVDRYATILGRREGTHVSPVLLTTQGVSPGLAGVADEVGVQLVEADGSVDEIANSVVRKLGYAPPLPE